MNVINIHFFSTVTCFIKIMHNSEEKRKDTLYNCTNMKLTFIEYKKMCFASFPMSFNFVCDLFMDFKHIQIVQ